MVTPQGVPVFSDLACPANVMAISTSPWREAAIAAAANV